MSILIKGMDMPKNCLTCKLRGDGSDSKYIWDCPFTGFEYTREDGETGRLDECPLIELPPHGDLIDLKAPFKAQYFDDMTEEWEEKMGTVEDVLYSCMVDEMPPITIPAEEE